MVWWLRPRGSPRARARSRRLRRWPAFPARVGGDGGGAGGAGRARQSGAGGRAAPAGGCAASLRSRVNVLIPGKACRRVTVGHRRSSVAKRERRSSSASFLATSPSTAASMSIKRVRWGLARSVGSRASAGGAGSTSSARDRRARAGATASRPGGVSAAGRRAPARGHGRDDEPPRRTQKAQQSDATDPQARGVRAARRRGGRS